MERYPKKVSGDQEALDWIFANALGNIIIKDAAPASGDMKANTMAYYNNELYIKLANGGLYKFTLTPV